MNNGYVEIDFLAWSERRCLRLHQVSSSLSVESLIHQVIVQDRTHFRVFIVTRAQRPNGGAEFADLARIMQALEEILACTRSLRERLGHGFCENREVISDIGCGGTGADRVQQPYEYCFITGTHPAQKRDRLIDSAKNQILHRLDWRAVLGTARE